MKYLVVSTNTKDVSPFLEAEAQRIAELRAAGTITAIWLKTDFSGAVLMLECADEAEATAALSTLPIVINGATAFVITEIVDPDEVQVSVDEHAQPSVPGAMRPEDMLEDEQDARIINGIQIRKGTLGAFIANARRLDAYPGGSAERGEILDQLRVLAPAVRAVGLLEVFEPRGEVLRQIFAEPEPVR
jgi:hypothetical protein